ncbi:hypothetical protein BOTBODRAFT_30062 [Botryobasidium botryosum FD-172 SS1]|uniref:AB hydrolase-1 domain-containing protein n=1 Tax=Botryobasidium botryosum (strain FD-172 SS1) TaxID=930990 RepID=A0A067N0D6_BOTB1|nr:hypothetical protein BOTBODRAFT_30062 [Botryobasidium botryosum FD-172 SS1]
MSTDTLIRSGEAPFPIAGIDKACKTWYTVCGDLKNGKTPLIGLHGGPGAGHSDLLPLFDLYTSHGIPVVLYDQIGTGLSTHLREKMGDGEFWVEQLFFDQLNSLMDHLDIQDALTKGIAEGTTKSPEFEAAFSVFFERFMCQIVPVPEDIAKSFETLYGDPTVLHTMWGNLPFGCNGTLKGYSVIDDLHRITAPTLIVHGRWEPAQESAVEPFFKYIPRVRWHTFEKSSHFPHHEEREKYMQVVGGFLLDN